MNELTPGRWRRIRTVLERALDVPATARSALLDRLCHGDDPLRAEIESLLAAEAGARRLLDVPVGEVAGQLLAEVMHPPLELNPLPGRRVGAYRLVREIARGGMGIVFLAERADGQVEQQVALKLLRHGIESTLVRRFLSERQILASLTHPHIARFLDCGVDQDGWPYLAMEYVEGQPITRYCDERRLGVEERLRLFLDVCGAVQCAHRNLVVHQDLKPSNILVTGAGEVKLLDFGIARLLEVAPGGAAAASTATGPRLMTPAYASPEQLRGEPLTTSSDIYSLGLVLYELLAGQPAYRADHRSPLEWARLVHEHQPPLPSARLRRAEPRVPDDDPDAAAGPAVISAARRTSVDRLGRALRGDLDAIVSMAIRNEPELRYGSVEALAADIHRHLDGRPVMARRSTHWYRARKLLKRHWIEATAATVVALALLSGASLAIWQAKAADRERARAEVALRRSEDVTAFLIDLFEDSDPASALGDTVAARELLRRGVIQAEALSAQPLVQAQILHALARIHMNLGRHEEAEGLLRRGLDLRRQHLDEADPGVVESLVALGHLQRGQGRWQDAEDTYRHAIDLQRQSLHDGHPNFAATLLGLAQVLALTDLGEAERLGREALEIRRRSLAPGHPLVGDAKIGLATILRRRGHDHEAEVLFRLAVTRHPDGFAREDLEGARSMLHLADMLRERPHGLAEAESLYRQALQIQRRQLGDDHPVLVHGLHSLAAVLGARGDFPAAEALLRDVIALKSRIYGPHSGRVANTTAVLAGQYLAQGRLAEAELLNRESLAIWDRSVGREHTATAGVLSELAVVVAAQERYDEAEALHREALEIRQRLIGPHAGPVGLSWLGLADLYRTNGRYAEAETGYRRALDILRNYVGDEHPHTGAACAGLAALYEERRNASAPTPVRGRPARPGLGPDSVPGCPA
jgi:eukaryotic-like serine/threonine-protein kinase